MDIENCDTWAGIKLTTHSNTRRPVAQRNFLKIYFTFMSMSCGCRSLWGGPKVAASNSNTPVRQAGVEALHRGVGQTHPHGFMPLDGWLAAACSAVRYQLCQNLPSCLLSGHPKVSRWAFMVKAIEEGCGSMGILNWGLGAEERNQEGHGHTVSHIQPMPFF